MANRLKGDVDLRVGDQVFRLLFDVDALCEIEHAHGGKPVDLVVKGWWVDGALDQASIPADVARLMMWAGLHHYHPAVDLAAAGAMILDLGEVVAVNRLVEALVGAFPDPDPAAAEAAAGVETDAAAPDPDKPRGWDWEKLLGSWLDLEVGTAAEFWGSTPRMLRLHFDAAARREQRHHNQRAWLAWHTAVLPLAKDFPPLEKLTGQPTPKAAQQTWEQQLDILKSMTAAAGAEAEAKARKRPTGLGH